MSTSATPEQPACAGGNPPECCVPLNDQRCPSCGSEWWLQTMRVRGERRCWEPECGHVWTVGR